MKQILLILSFAGVITSVWGGPILITSPMPLAEALQRIANTNTTDLELIRALEVVHTSSSTNEGPRFWSNIANNTNYSIQHRKRAILQLFSRYFKPGMTFKEIAGLLDHPAWMASSRTSYYGPGAPPPGGDPDDEWAFVIPFFASPQETVIDFRFKEKLTEGEHNLSECLQGKFTGDQIEHIKVLGIVSEEFLSRPIRRVYNSFGIPGAYPNSYVQQ